ncbi:MAG: ATP-binding cassette domain-containing protein, partial [Methylococcales bacterium]|nr:ATP-binding cassette domain-containing protein [Methylococcales bacterium]
PTALFNAGLIIMGLSLVAGVVSFLYSYYGHWLTHRVAYDFRNDFYNAIQGLPFSFHDSAHTGDLMSRATSEISEAQWFAGIRSAELVNICFMLTATTIAMLMVNVRVTVIGLLPIVVMVFAVIRFGGIVRPLFKLIQGNLGTLSSTMQESLTGIRVVKAFAREPYEIEKFNQDNDTWYSSRVRMVRVWGKNWPLFTLLVSSSILIILWVGGPMTVEGGVLSKGDLFILISYVLMMQGPVQQLGFVVNRAATAGVAAGRVFEIMDRPNEVADRPNALALERATGQVDFEQVTFGYNSEQTILHEVSFSAEPGQRIALIGPTGSGKSTIINLLPRFYEQQAGRILVDGHDIRDLTARSLRDNIGTVLQDTFLFSTTIAGNIEYGRRTATRDEVIAAAKAARAHGFIMQFPNGYDTAVGERGVTLSGGQKQRIAIARALLTDPAILVLDDALSSVDTETEHLIQLALEELMQGRTTFIIAQRLLTLKGADTILVLDDGRIVERGTHDELLAHNGLYREMYDLQLKDQDQNKIWEAVASLTELPEADSSMPRHSNAFLLHGVTGSGKTEIYMHAIERALAQGQQAIVLVPEIALTPQTVRRFAARFPGRVAMLHSRLSTGERYDTWR